MRGSTAKTERSYYHGIPLEIGSLGRIKSAKVPSSRLHIKTRTMYEGAMDRFKAEQEADRGL